MKASITELVIAFNTELTNGIIQEGIARELANRLLKLRKRLGLNPKYNIAMYVDTEDATIA